MNFDSCILRLLLFKCIIDFTMAKVISIVFSIVNFKVTFNLLFFSTNKPQTYFWIQNHAILKPQQLMFIQHSIAFNGSPYYR